MDIKIFRKKLDELRLEAHWLRISVLALCALCIVLTFGVLNKKTIVTIQPWTLNTVAEVTEADASRSYKEAWAMAVALLVGNVQPQNVNFIAEHLKPILAPEIYHETIDAIHANAQLLRDDRLSIRFEPREIVYEKSTDKVFVFGHSFTRLGTSLEKEERTPRTYEFKFKIANYAPMLTEIDTYQGDPRTRDMLERLEKQEQRQIDRERRNAERQGIRYRPKKTEDSLKE